MSGPSRTQRPMSPLRAFFHHETSAGLILMACALAAIAVANSPLAPGYFATLHAYAGPLSVQHWVNDGLMAVFFLLVGLEIKREILTGQLATWGKRTLPGVAAVGGMAIPGIVYVMLNLNNSGALRGWAIPAATDIAFALGVMSLLGSRVPSSLKIFLAALAIIDDLGAVIIIAIFYTANINVAALLGAVFVFGILRSLCAANFQDLRIYLALGAVLWVLLLVSGVHATLAGVLLALTIPITTASATQDPSRQTAPLHRLESLLHAPVAFAILPIFGFANAGVSFASITPAIMTDTLAVGVAAGLLIGKVVGIFGAVALMVRLRLADLPTHATWLQVLGVAFLCGIGFTMSLFIGLLAFEDPHMQDRVKYGILAGSLLAGVLGYGILRIAGRRAL